MFQSINSLAVYVIRNSYTYFFCYNKIYEAMQKNATLIKVSNSRIIRNSHFSVRISYMYIYLLQVPSPISPNLIKTKDVRQREATFIASATKCQPHLHNTRTFKATLRYG